MIKLVSLLVSRREGIVSHTRTDIDPVPAFHPDVCAIGHAALHPVAQASHSHFAHHWLDYARIAIVAAGIAISHFYPVPAIAGFDPVGLAAALLGGYPIFREAIRDLLTRRMTMELSMSIALVAALSIREVFTASVIIIFVLAAEIVEEMTMDRGHRAVEDLLGGLPDTAELLGANAASPGDIAVVATATLQTGDVVLVRPGRRVPVDGVVVEGSGFVEQSAITGELNPVEVTRGAVVYAGSIVYGGSRSGALHVRIESLGSQTVFGRMIEALRRAEESQAPVQKLADRLAGYLVYFALACAALTLAITHNATSTIAVIIVAGACGIAAGTPLAILGALGRAARIGAIVKGGSWMEKLGTVDTVVFDKTGTLTLGRPEVVDIQTAPGVSPTELVRIAASAEVYSEHPLARAIVRKGAGLDMTQPKEFAYHPGRGVTSLVDGKFTVAGSRAFLRDMGVPLTQPSPGAPALSEVAVAQAGRLLGYIFIADIVRGEAKRAVARLRSLGLHLVLMTGDTDAIAGVIGQSFGFDRIHADLLPDGKLARLRELKAEGRKVVMVGDGVNDAPALAAADVPISMGSGTDIAQQFSGVLLIGDDLGKLGDLVALARRCRKIILFNFAGTLLVDAAGMALAAFGLLSPILAGVVHVSSELLFILNSARLLPLQRRR
jgi:heavy metal translocating P-type ATPase